MDFSNTQSIALLRDIFACSHRQRENRPGDVLVSVGNEGAAIGDKQILHFVRLTVLVDDRGFRIIAHPGRSDLMNDPAAVQEAVELIPGRHCVQRRPAKLVDNFAEGILHVLRLLDLIPWLLASW